MKRVHCVGAIVSDGSGRLLLVQRGHEPQAGRWSLPGGRVEPAETGHQALVREVHEETGLDVSPGPLVGTVERPGPGGVVYEIRDYSAFAVSGILAAGDDAADARWVALEEVGQLPLTSGLLEVLQDWGVLGVAGPPAE